VSKHEVTNSDSFTGGQEFQSESHLGNAGSSVISQVYMKAHSVMIMFTQGPDQELPAPDAVIYLNLPVDVA
jgi:hypothetical protein